ncbi:Transposase IS200 like [Thorsellia anophelis DSM 18579]|uniref:Transposase IS200 like n=1 Tax=Thorsellia anophelis DSM 18579 TaxID=1123402 RepID=A0A1I0BNP8_9GAMM|nr:Transposase IS200 like [Thorsellia anophelis DSM 18579]
MNFNWSMRKNQDIRHRRNCVFLIHVYLVFVTKYRRDVFTKTIQDESCLIFTDVCADFESELFEFDGEDDYVHLLVNSRQRRLFLNSSIDSRAYLVG